MVLCLIYITCSVRPPHFQPASPKSLREYVELVLFVLIFNGIERNPYYPSSPLSTVACTLQVLPQTVPDPRLEPTRSLFDLQVTLIPGDGIGNEITDSVKEIFEAANAPIEWDQYNVSGMSSQGEDLFKQAMESLKRNKVGLKGAFRIHCCLQNAV